MALSTPSRAGLSMSSRLEVGVITPSFMVDTKGTPHLPRAGPTVIGHQSKLRFTELR